MKRACIVGNISVRIVDAATLNEGKWLIDNIVNAFLHMLGIVNDIVYNTYFYSLLVMHGKNSERIESYQQIEYLGSCTRVFIPMHEGVHWGLAVLDKSTKYLSIFDSLHEPLKMFKAGVLLDWANSLSLQNWPNDWILDKRTELSMHQMNSSDCGLFVCVNALLLVSGKDTRFDRSKIRGMRKAIWRCLVLKDVVIDVERMQG